MKLTKTKLRQIIKEEFQRAIKESSYKTVNAQLDQLEDIVATGVEKQQGLMSIAVALKDEGFRDASVDDGALTFTGDDGELYGVAKPGRVDLAGDITAREVGPYVLGVIGGDEEEDEDPRSSLGGMVDVDYEDQVGAPPPRGLEERTITKSELQEIIKQELSEALPPHLQSKVDAYEKKKQKFSITDVTPPGYGPDDEEEEPLKLGTPEEDPMKRTRKGRGQASRLRKTVMNK